MTEQKSIRTISVQPDGTWEVIFDGVIRPGNGWVYEDRGKVPLKDLPKPFRARLMRIKALICAQRGNDELLQWRRKDAITHEDQMWWLCTRSKDYSRRKRGNKKFKGCRSEILSRPLSERHPANSCAFQS